jgi:ketosteroid isomerase-like protein
MKKYLSAVVATLAVALLAFSQFGCASPQNTNTNTVSMATPEPTPDKAAIEAELTKIENDWPRIIKEHDAATVRRIEADDAVFVYPDGSPGDKAQDVKDMESGSLSADSWEVLDLKVNVMDSDAAFVTGRNVIKGGKYKMPNGKIQDISGEYRWIDTYARRNGQWQEVAGCTTKVQNEAAATPTPKALPSPGASPAMKPMASPKATPAAKTAPAAKAPAPVTMQPIKPVPAPTKTKTP